MPMNTGWFAAAALVIAVVTMGCGGLATTQSMRPAPTLAPTPRSPDLPGATPPPVSAVPEAFLDAILEESASLSSVDVSQIIVTRAGAVTWPDGSLGCPQPDMTYTQAVVDGYWVVVQAGGDEYDFRVGSTGDFRLCQQRPGRPSMTIEIPPDIY